MRGHIGFKIPRFVPVLVNGFALDVLVARPNDPAAPYSFVNGFAVDLLVSDTEKDMQRLAAVSGLTIDVLVTTPEGT